MGASVAQNELTGTVSATVTAAQLGGGAVTVAADNTSLIEALTFAGAAIFGVSNSVGLAFSGAGAGSGNKIHNVVEAIVRNSNVAAARLALKGCLLPTS